ncbi:MAG: DNA polymerase III subunit delta' [Pseudomonadota bacterium]
MSELLPWLMPLWARITPSIASGRISHALLLSGPAGVGKALFARLLARSLLCEKPQADGHACGICNSCHLLNVGNHPDILSIEPEEDAKIISVDQIRALTGYTMLKPQHGRRRVTVIPQAHLMNTQSANSLLKNLEEPPPHGMFILVTDKLSALLPTVRSRCQRIDFAPPALDAARAWLQIQPHMGDVDAALGLANGAPLRALQIMQDGVWLRRSALFEDFQRVVGGAQDPLISAEKWLKSGAMEVLIWLESWLSDSVCCKLAQDAGRWRNPDMAGALTRMAEQVDARAVLQLLSKVQDALRSLSTSINQQLVLEDILIACAELRARPAENVR